MKTKIILTILLLISIFYAKITRDNFIKAEYQKQVYKQNDSLSNVKILSKMQENDSLLQLLQTKVFTKTDTIEIKTIEKDTLIKQIAGNDTLYKFSTKYTNNRFILDITANLKLPSQKNYFNFKYVSFPDTIETGINFNKHTKLLSSYAIVNNKKYNSKTNIYEKLYKSFYDDFIYKEPYFWYDRINISIGIGYNYKSEFLPVLCIGYGFNIKEFKNLLK